VESNNTRLTSIRIGPDLAVSTMSAPATAGAGYDSHHRNDAEPGRRKRRHLRDPVLPFRQFLPRRERHAARQPRGANSRHRIEQCHDDSVNPVGDADRSALPDRERGRRNALRNRSRRTTRAYVIIRVGPDLVVSSIVARRAGSGGTIAITDTTANSGSGKQTPRRRRSTCRRTTRSTQATSG
jgi:hypothetical protein